MQDLIYHDRCGEWRRRWVLRLASPFEWWSVAGWLWQHVLRSPSAEVSLWTRDDDWHPLGTSSEVRISVFGFLFWLWCDRERGPIASACLPLYLDEPERYAEEIEDAGGIEYLKRVAAAEARMLRRKCPSRLKDQKYEGAKR